tara:strand:+ start:93 stop:320 length:228 start_codon:yes stop_codon:yes gene_type:complete
MDKLITEIEERKKYIWEDYLRDKDLFWFDQEYTHITNLLNDIEGWYFDETDNFIYQTAYITALENVLSQLQREEE